MAMYEDRTLREGPEGHAGDDRFRGAGRVRAGGVGTSVREGKAVSMPTPKKKSQRAIDAELKRRGYDVSALTPDRRREVYDSVVRGGGKLGRV